MLECFSFDFTVKNLFVVLIEKWIFEVKNYPEYPADSGYIRATLLVYDGAVIGGDISSIEQNGFIQGFEFPNVSSREAGQ